MANTQIDPQKQTVESCLRSKKYYIDFYQREYVWNKETVETLLKDIFWSFENSYKQYGESELSEEVMSKYTWYYLNVFITNKVDGKIFIVDGQQRLTSLTLIATYLYHRISDENLKNVLKDCIFSADRYAGNIYCIDHKKRKRLMDCIFLHDGDNPPLSFENTTEETLFNRYQDIKNFFNGKGFPEKKLLVFAHYFLERLVMVELAIDKDDTPMVFEVINDRGEALKQFEILKGKLLGTLSKDDTEKYTELWDASLAQLKGMEDTFFVDYLKAKFMFSTNSKLLITINNSFHRYIFEPDNEIASSLQFRRQDENAASNVKTFISQKLTYYSRLYKKIRDNQDEFLGYDNNVNELNGQYQNILAACKENDPQENQKIHIIAREYDRLNMLLRLNGVYDSNDLQDLVFKLNKLLPETEPSEYREVFNNLLVEEIIQKTGKDKISSLLEYERFLQRDFTNMDKRTLRYFFARVEKFICDGIGKEMNFSIYDISTKSSAQKGFHVEHIFSRNQESISKFANEEEFEILRNRLGCLLILRGKDNISSGNELYEDKLKTYSNGLEWGRTLVSDTYHANVTLNEFNNTFKSKHHIGFEPIANFDKNALQQRSQLLYAIVKEIWDF